MVARAAHSAGNTATRFLSVARDRAFKTQILIVHEGFPRNEFYAKKALAYEANKFYNLPANFKWPVVEMPSFLVPRKIGHCMEDYGKFGDVQETIMAPLASSLESALGGLLPELESVRVLFASPFESPTIDETIDTITRTGVEQLIVLPLEPHFSCSRSGLLLNEAVRCVEEKTIASNGNERKRIVTKSPIEFDLSCIERWSCHPFITNVWSARLESIRKEIDSVLFVAPILRGNGRRDYERSVYASAERIISETRVAFPWRVAFFNGWNQWELPIRESIQSQLRRWKERTVAVIPISSVVPSFDTISVLPRLVESSDRATVLSPMLNRMVVDGLTEVLKNHLLGRRSAQLQLRCDWCFRSDCQRTREMLS